MCKNLTTGRAAVITPATMLWRTSEECEKCLSAGLGFGAMPTDEALPVLERIFCEYLDSHRLIGTLGGSKARWANVRTITNDHWHSGNVVLAGDSAHTANFTIGMGATLAIGDAVTLADGLRDQGDIESPLTRYEVRRTAEIAAAGAPARSSGAPGSPAGSATGSSRGSHGPG
jgi:2-polyprenyl-6-methoxyphenol hydroxylase-like FAD-dependent oxidoreductase